MSDSYQKIAEVINSSSKFLILSHAGPDADAYTSSLALAIGLRKLGKEALVANQSGVNKNYNFIKQVTEVQSEFPGLDYDWIIACDSANLSRLGDEYKEKLSGHEKIINIDHHHNSNDHFGEFNLVLDDVSSTAEIIANLLSELKVDLDAELATLLLTGIYTDTVSMQRGMGTNTYAVANTLYAAGADLESFIDSFFWSKPFNLLQLEAEAISNINLKMNNLYAEICIQPELLTKYALSPKDCDAIKDIGLQIEGVLVSSMIRKDNDLWKVSLRSKSPVDVNKVAQQLGGGGHPGAAGIKWKGELKELLQKLDEILAQELKS